MRDPGCHHTPIYASNTHARLKHQEKPATGILVVEGRFGDKVLYLGWYGFRPNPAAQKGVEGYLDMLNLVVTVDSPISPGNTPFTESSPRAPSLGKSECTLSAGGWSA